MLEGLTVFGVAIATSIAAASGEHVGAKLGEGLVSLSRKFLNVLRRKDPKTASDIEAVVQKPELATEQPQTYGIPALTAKVEEAAQSEPEIQRLAQEIQTAVQVQPGAIANMTKLAEKIGVVNQGTIVNQTNTFEF